MTPLTWIEELYWSVTPLIYWILGVAMIVLSILDYYSYAFHPLEMNIFLDQDILQDHTKMTKLVSSAAVSVLRRTASESFS